MRRREVLQIITCALAFAPDTIAAQIAAKTYRIGTLTVGPAIPPTEGTGKMLIEGLTQRGYKLGENLGYEARGAAGKIPQMANLMQELKAANVDVVVTVGYPSAAAAKASGVPTVIASGSGDPVVTGLVQSLAHPGGNVTGIADDAAALSTKRLGLLKAVSPQLRRVAMLWNKDDRGMTQRYDASAKAAQELGVTVQALGVRELFAIVEHMDAEAGVGGDAREVPADVSCADHVERRRGRDRIDIDLHLTAADET